MPDSKVINIFRGVDAPMPEHEDTISLLTHPIALATKKWYRSASGHIASEAYGKGEWFSYREERLRGIEDIYALLAKLAGETRTFAIRGRLLPGRKPEQVARRKHAREGSGPFFEERPRRWLMLDVDAPDGGGGDVESDVRTYLAQLPSWMSCATCVAQLSASAGFKAGFRAHLWFWLARPVGEKDLVSWGKELNDRAGRQIIDTSVFRTVQPHYIADPVCEEGVVDPYTGGRLVKVVGTVDAVDFPAEVGGHVRDWKAIAARLEASDNTRIHDHLRDAAGAYFCARGASADEGELKDELMRRLSAALTALGRSDYSEVDVDREIASGRDYAQRMGEVGGELQIAPSGAPFANPHNLSILLTKGEWAGCWAYDVRSLRCKVIKDLPSGGGPAPRDVEDADGQRIAAYLNRRHMCPATGRVVLDALPALCKEAPYDKVREYLGGLTWDGVDRVKSWLTTYCGAEESEYTQEVGRIMLISSVARAMRPGCAVDTVVIWEGMTGIGKSKGLEDLYGKEFYSSCLPSIQDKDGVMALHGPWCVEVGEIDQYFAGRASDQMMKGFITTHTDDFRPPYGRTTERHPRSCVLVGTTNADEYLTDMTSHRRYLPVRCVKVDRGAIRRDRDQLWAEAKVLWEADTAWWYEATDPRFLAEQIARREGDEWTERVSRALARGAQCAFSEVGIPPIPAGAASVTNAQMWAHVLNIANPSNREGRRLKRVMAELGWVPSRTKSERGYRRP